MIIRKTHTQKKKTQTTKIEEKKTRAQNKEYIILNNKQRHLSAVFTLNPIGSSRIPIEMNKRKTRVFSVTAYLVCFSDDFTTPPARLL